MVEVVHGASVYVPPAGAGIGPGATPPSEQEVTNVISPAHADVSMPSFTAMLHEQSARTPTQTETPHDAVKPS